MMIITITISITITITIDRDENIQATVYHKETDHQSYLNSKSEDPLCLKRNIPFSQALRLIWICSAITAFEDESVKLIQKFVEWGYKADDIKKKLNRQVISQEKSFSRNPK